LDSIALYQPDEVLKSRLVSPDELAEYVRLLVAAAAQTAKTSTPAQLDIVMAVKPGRRARAWLVSANGVQDPGSLKQALEAIRSIEVRGGPVAFAMRGTTGGAESMVGDGAAPPMPQEWKDAASGKKDVLVPDGILEAVWPD
jgi:hypothetical protein